MTRAYEVVFQAATMRVCPTDARDCRHNETKTTGGLRDSPGRAFGQRWSTGASAHAVSGLRNEASPMGHPGLRTFARMQPQLGKRRRSPTTRTSGRPRNLDASPALLSMTIPPPTCLVDLRSR